MRLGTALAARQPLEEVRGQATLAESLGYGSIWIPEIAGRDALVTCALLAESTERIGLATGIVPLKSRGATLTAMGAATVAEVAPGRFRLGVGVGHVETVGPWFGRGAPPGVEEAEGDLRTIAALLRGERLEGGDHGRLRGVHHPAPPPLVLAALSPRMVEVSGRLADGLVVNWVTAARAGELARMARAARADAGLPAEGFEVSCYVPVCVTEDAAAARLALARQVAAYGKLRAYARSMSACGFEDEVAELATIGRGEEERVPAALLDALAAIGPADEVRARLAEFAAAGVEEIVIAPVPLPGEAAWPSMVETWTALAPAG
jgi:5,10-methylenetetrahydromethanopterin reductase